MSDSTMLALSALLHAQPDADGRVSPLSHALTPQSLPHVPYTADTSASLSMVTQSLATVSLTNPPYHLAYLHSWPLITAPSPTDPKGTPIPALDFDGERRTLIDSLTKSHRALRIFISHATTENLLRILTRGCRVLHYSGHGMPGCLAFENVSDGTMHAVNGPSLRTLLTAGQNTTNHTALKLFVVSACYSESTAQALIDAGVKHVIAIRADSQVHDSAAQSFMSQFYYALFIGRTIKDSFDTAKAAVLTSNNIHSEREQSKFLLLPNGGVDHNVSIFDDIIEGTLSNLSDSETRNNLHTMPDIYIGRHHEQQSIISRLVKKKKKLLTLIGNIGIGKSMLAQSAALYMARRNYYHGIFYIDCKLLIQQPTATLATLCSQAMNESQCIDRIYNDNTQLINTLKNDAQYKSEKFLFVFDDAEITYSELAQSQRSLTNFLSLLLTNTVCQALVTSLDSLSIRDIEESTLRIESLSPNDSTKLFFALRPREIPYNEFGYHGNNSIEAARKLSQHPALIAMNGIPRRVLKCSKFLLDGSMDGLIDYSQRLLVEEKEEEMKRKSNYKMEIILDGDSEAIELWRATSGNYECPYNHLQDNLQQHLLAHSHMNISTVSRGFCPADLSLIKYRIYALQNQSTAQSSAELASLTSVSLPTFAKFWPWFQSIVYVVSHCQSLWNLQLSPLNTSDSPIPALHSFLTRDQCQSMLRSMVDAGHPSPFLLRLSENHPRCVTVAWIDHRDQCEKYTLITITDASTHTKADRASFSIAVNNGETQTFEDLESLLLSVMVFQIIYPGVSKHQLFH